MYTFLTQHIRVILVAIAVEVILLASGLAFVSLLQPPAVEAPITEAPSKELQAANLLLTLGGELVDLVNSQSPAEAFAYLEQVYATEPDVAKHCHGLVHIIGHTAYEKYGFTKATAFANDACGSGYMHGLVEEHIPTLNNLTEELPQVCSLNDGRCFHGLGHGLMTHEGNDVGKALHWCDLLTQADQRVQCGEGVFMEYYGADTEEEATARINPGTPFAICEEPWAPMYQSTCYFYAPRFFYKLIQQVSTNVFSWCNAVDTNWQYDCYRGIGSMAMKYTIKEPATVLQFCELAPEAYRVACVRGMIGYYIVHFASIEPAAALCETISSLYQNDCRSVVNSSRKYYPTKS